jgi:hypothetical protein
MRIVKTSNVDSSQIEAKYDKAKISVQLVSDYDSSLLNNISTIADLASGAYGLFNSGENKHVLPEDLKQQVRLVFRDETLDDNKLSRIPVKVLCERFPNVDPNSIQVGDVIRVNVSRITNESSTDLEAVLEIASTIVHEATHEIEFETQGWTSEVGPQAAERQFYSWAMQNIQRIISIPELMQTYQQPQEPMKFPGLQRQPKPMIEFPGTQQVAANTETSFTKGS